MASQMEPRGCARACGLARGGGPRRSQDRLGSVLFSSCRSGSLFWSSWAPLGVVFGRSVGRFGAFSACQLIDSTHQLINSSIQPINSSTHRVHMSLHVYTICTYTRVRNTYVNKQYTYTYMKCICMHCVTYITIFQIYAATCLDGPADCALRD